jgi:hypothetical protein
MCLRRTHRQLAFLAPLAMVAACAADSGDPLKLSASASGGATTGASSSAMGPASATTSGGYPTVGSTPAGTATTGAATSSSTATGTGGASSSSTPTAAGINPTPDAGGNPIDASAAQVDAPPPCTTCALTLTYKTTMPGDDVNNIEFDVQVANEGTASQALAQMTIQYYFNADGASDLTGQINNASVSTPNAPPYFQDINGAQMTFSSLGPVTTSADTILTISFASGSLPAGGTLEVDVQFHSGDYSTYFDQSNDYSYDGSDATAFTTSDTITVEVSGAIVWGVAP